jgi:hypothetical protein
MKPAFERNNTHKEALLSLDVAIRNLKELPIGTVRRPLTSSLECVHIVVVAAHKVGQVLANNTAGKFSNGSGPERPEV